MSLGIWGINLDLNLGNTKKALLNEVLAEKNFWMNITTQRNTEWNYQNQIGLTKGKWRAMII